jgi:miniconductance mechanosensitive channel
MSEVNQKISEWIIAQLVSYGINPQSASVLDGWIVLVLIILIVLVVNVLLRWGVMRLVHWMVHHTKVTWDDILFDDKVLRSLCNIIMPIIIKIVMPMAIVALDIKLMWFVSVLYMGVDIAVVIMGLLFANCFIKAVYELFVNRPGWEGRPIKGLLQTCQVLLIIIGIILIVSIVIDKSPALLLTGLGASAAVISFIFKDSLLGLIAGIQLSVNNMLKVGDWIEMPGRGIDGVVVEVSLTTVKIRGWNNTLQTIPPYLLISEPFDNWQAMRDSGGRRIKRSLNVDMTSVAFVSDQMIEELRSNSVTSAVMANVATETLEGARLTNLDLYIRYINRYIDEHPRVNHTMISMVRELQPTEWGVPIELYFFSSDVNWIPHEHLQTEVISHVVALAPLFGVRLYQAPSTLDLRR